MNSKIRYERQTMLPEIGEEGQRHLAESKIVVIGAGGLGSPILLYLTAAGIGTIGVVDDDVISESNLQRQILYTTPQLGTPKAPEATLHLKELNPDINIHCHNLRLTQENVGEILAPYEIVIDATDNFTTRKILDQYTAEKKIPYIYGSVSGFTGQISIFNTGNAGRYADLFPDIHHANDEVAVGVLGAVPGVIGSMQAAEAVKLLLGIGEPLVGKLLTIDLLTHLYEIYDLSY